MNGVFYQIFFCIAALEKAIGLAVADADIATICGEVDNFIHEEL